MSQRKNNEQTALKKMSRDKQKKYMEEWFFEHYDEPGNCCPIDEGDYFYVWGGPYEAYDELMGQFAGEVSEKLIQELADELSDISSDWEKKGYLDEEIEPNPEYYESFIAEINQTKKAMEIQLDENIKNYILKLLYANELQFLKHTFLKLL